MRNMTDRVTISPLGDAAVLVEWSRSLRLHTLEQVWSAHSAIRQALAASVLDIVPAYASILVRFDPATAGLAAIMASVRGALERAAAMQSSPIRSFHVGVCFHDEYALDLATIATEVKLPASAVAEEFCAATYRVAFLGYTAGFPYLLGLPKSLAVRRLLAPRQQVPAGSVGIAAGQCGVYPRTTPGGWKILGRTAAALFAPELDEPALFRPGDTVRFHPVDSLADARAMPA